MTAYADGSLWYYAPNKGGAVAFAVLFFLSGVIHVWQAFRYQSWKLTFFAPWGCLILTGGYITRAIGAWEYDNLDVFISSSVLLVLGPPVYAATLYIVLGRVMYYVPWLALLHPGRVISTWIGLDVLCEVLLGSGAPRTSNTSLTKSEQNVGWGLIKAGMILQCLLLIGFLSLAGLFHFNCSRHGVARRIRGAMFLLYGVGILILERSILRTIEMFEGYEGTIATSEPIFYVLEAGAMLLVTYALNNWHPAMLLPSNNKIYLGTDGVSERLGPGWVDKRPKLLTFFDPGDIGSCFSKRYAHDKFWERDEGKLVNNEQHSKAKEVPGSTA